MRNRLIVKKVILMLFLVVAIHSMGSGLMTASAQVIKQAFKPRKVLKDIQGDFLIIGNTNMGPLNGSADNKRAAFLKIDDFYIPQAFENQSGTVMRFFNRSKPGLESQITNSSSATLKYPSEIDGMKECTHILYAGLYWYGRGGANLPNKNSIRFYHPQSYHQDVAKGILADEVIEPANADGMYLAYRDVTKEITTLGLGTKGGTTIGEGRYAVGNIASSIDANPEHGNFAGWYMVVVYNTPGLSVKDISIYDGIGFVNPKLEHSEVDIPVKDFTSVKEGTVNAKLGFLAVEGDANEQGDYLKMKNNLTGNWDSLKHTENTTDNFFNSTIITPSGTRNRSMVNNFGVDIAEFKLPNTGNQYIQNEQSVAQFRIGSTRDSFALLNLVLAVESDPDDGVQVPRFGKEAPEVFEICANGDAVFESTAGTNEVEWQYSIGGDRWELLSLYRNLRVLTIDGKSSLEIDGPRLKFTRASKIWNSLLVRAKLKVGITHITGGGGGRPCEIFSKPTRIVIVDERAFTKNLSPIVVCPGRTISAGVEVTAGTVVWQYLEDQSNIWKDIGPEGYGDHLSASGLSLNITDADRSLNKLKVRAKILAAASCSEVFSTERPIIVEDQNLFSTNLNNTMSVCIRGNAAISVATLNHTPVSWEYFDTADNAWKKISESNSLFSIAGNTIKITSARQSLDGMKIRAATEDPKGCSSISEVMQIKVRGCEVLMNPMLPAKSNK